MRCVRCGAPTCRLRRSDPPFGGVYAIRQNHRVSTGGATFAAALYYLQPPHALHQMQTRARDCCAAGAVTTGCTHEVTQVCPVYTDRLGPWCVAAYRVAITELGRSPQSRSEVTASAIVVGGAL
jgi:hypothetical protein